MNRTLLLGLDGAAFRILDPLMENGTMPFLKSFARRGVRAGLLSTANPLTPPAWTSLITGRTPGNHGIIDFIWAEERKTDHYFTLYNFRDIRCETIWSIVSRQGGRVCSLNFPMMSPPPAINGIIIPGLVSWKHLRRNIHPSGLYEKLKELPGFNAKELAWDFNLEKKAERGVPPEEYEHWVEFHIRRERLWFEIARYIMKNDPCDLTAILFDGPDKLMHMGYRFLDPAVFPESPTEHDIKMRDLCLEYFRELDGFLAELVSLAGEDTHVIMASDHGFGPSQTVFRVNTWLCENGYLAWKNMEGMDAQARLNAQKIIDQHFVLLDWEKTTAYARTVTSNGIYIRVAREAGKSGVPPHEYEAFRARLAAELLAYRDPATGIQVVQRVMTREEAYPGAHNGQAPDLTLVMHDFSFVSILEKRPVVLHRPEIEGTHYPEGVFLAAGPGVKRNAVAERFSIEDVAPAVLHCCGLPIPRDFEGRVPSRIFEESFLERHPVIAGEPTVPVDSFDGKTEKPLMEAEEKKEIFDQLKALGYIE